MHANGTHHESNGTNGLAKRPYHIPTLAEAREKTPPVEGIGAWAEELRAAAFDAVKPDDVTAIVAAQVEKAKAGDATAAKFVLGYLTGSAAPKVKVIVEKTKIIERPRKRTGSTAKEVRVETADPPVPLAVDSPATRQMRRLVGLYLNANGGANLAALETVLEIPAEQLKAVLNCDWFASEHGQWSLTPAGRQQCG